MLLLVVSLHPIPALASAHDSELTDLIDGCRSAVSGADPRPCDLLIAELEGSTDAVTEPSDVEALAHALSNRSLVFVRAGDHEAARNDLDRALALLPVTGILLNRAYLELMDRRPAAALTDLDEILKTPQPPAIDRLARYNRALALTALGDVAGADAELRRLGEPPEISPDLAPLPPPVPGNSAATGIPDR